MEKSFLPIALSVALIVVMGSGAEPKKETMMLFAAASLVNVLGELEDSFTVKHPVVIKTNAASSGTLARQISQGITPEVFISASETWVHYLDSLSLVQERSITSIAFNQLVLITPNTGTKSNIAIDSSLNLLPLLGSGRLSMGDPAHVPAGKYAQQALEYFGWYDKLRPRMLPAKDVRSALMVVEMGESPLGIVYRTDAQKSKKVRVAGVFPSSTHKPIVYIGALCKESSAGKAFLDYINDPATDAIWQRYGFVRNR